MKPMKPIKPLKGNPAKSKGIGNTTATLENSVRKKVISNHINKGRRIQNCERAYKFLNEHLAYAK